jgi:ATP-dependent HslUV protease ATP-binding subunit HslU
VGYVGRDVESMIRDLVEVAVNMVRQEMFEEIRPTAEAAVTERLLDLLLPAPTGYKRFLSEKGLAGTGQGIDVVNADTDTSEADRFSRYQRTRDKLRQSLLAGKLEDRQVEIDVRERGPQVAAIMPGGGGDEMAGQMQEFFDKMMPGRTKRREMAVREARPRLLEQESERLIDEEKAIRAGLERAQQSGIVFIDEIDKVAGRGGEGRGPDVSREGVQRDILPIVEGSTVFTKHGVVQTDHILFIAAGAFHSTKPSDLIPELQGRFPLRAKLEALTADDFRRILVEPESALTKQMATLLAADGVTLTFSEDGVSEIAETAVRVNTQTEQIGARRLHTLMEKVLEEISFEAPEAGPKRLEVNAAYVKAQLKDIADREDLSRFIL